MSWGLPSSGTMVFVPMRQLSPVRAPEGKARSFPRKLCDPIDTRDTRKDVLEVWSRRRSRSQRHRIEGPAAHREQADADKATRDLEAAVGDVLVRDPIGGEVEGRPEQHRAQPRFGQQTGPTTGRNVERDNHAESLPVDGSSTRRGGSLRNEFPDFSQVS